MDEVEQIQNEDQKKKRDDYDDEEEEKKFEEDDDIFDTVSDLNNYLKKMNLN